MHRYQPIISTWFEARIQPLTFKTVTKVSDGNEWVYDTNIADYINIETGQLMTNFIPDIELETIISNINKQQS